MDPNFISADLAAQRDRLLDKYVDGILGEGEPGRTCGWKTNVQVPIQVPEGKKEWTNENGRTFHIPGLHHRLIVDMVRKNFEENPHLHYTPFQSWWRPPNELIGSEQCLYGDISSSEAFMSATHEINTDPYFRVTGCTLEKVVACVMAYSDATQLTQFGSASLWPIYVFPGNADSWFRLSPNTDADDHWAYIPTLPENLRNFILEISGQAASAPLFTHCKREMVQAVWQLLMDGDFIKAYRHSIVVRCSDGILRRIYIRLITYSADYPEKMLMLCLRDKGNCPCPLSKTTKSLIPQLGLKRDRERRESLARKDTHPTLFNVTEARKKIYGKTGLKVNSQSVEALLQPTSCIPTLNTFSQIVTHQSFNKYQMFTVDLMHEFELGVWKSVLLHLVRLMEQLGPTIINTFNNRYIFYHVFPFGRDTIRRFGDNVCALKKLGAQDYEDILQVGIPAQLCSV
ncbi:hypothetical protein M422DRAFT_173372 [Sphaerobolus stellatus SS14]|uniref:Unplaced genomic scaffold SPHSTscaffold_67, whole genome shotgun sequence n=1 Tax=Sphaerobolus stellatus (strain SS14) TaxID=990650 RepID=A0A0C9VH53_SPHS4|nr:hypothetical protein M422DRAFT_173372 [Sphaerobolus stellatus SS14]